MVELRDSCQGRKHHVLEVMDGMGPVLYVARRDNVKDVALNSSNFA
jgi:hypothetical protein